MLKPEYFNGKEAGLVAIYRQLEDFIMRDTARRIIQAGKLTATADNLLWRLEQMGESKAAIEKRLSELTGLARKELREVLQTAVRTSWADDAAVMEEADIELSDPLTNPEVVTVMDAEYQKSLGELTNLTRTTMDQAQSDLIQMLDTVAMRVDAGVQSYQEATATVLDAYAGRGVMVDYPTGAKRTLEAAVRCCVVTSMNQTAAQVTNQYVKEAGTNYVLVSAHVGARLAGKGQPPLADHAAWQGKAYCIRGSEEGFPNLLESTGYDINPETGAGTVVDPLGLHGYNCRHSHQPWSKELRNPYENMVASEENKKAYELSQKQRAMERAIRQTKRRLIVLGEQLAAADDPEKEKLQSEYDKLAYKLTEQNKAYNDFCKANNLSPQYDRNQVADFGKAEAKAANAAAKRYIKSSS